MTVEVVGGCSETNGVFSVGTKFVLSISFSSGQLVGRQFVKRAGRLASRSRLATNRAFGGNVAWVASGFRLPDF